MAKIIYEVYQNQNVHNAAYGKWYGRVKYLESLKVRPCKVSGEFEHP